MSDDTLLVLTGIGLPPYSARGLTQTLRSDRGGRQSAAHRQWHAGRSVAGAVPQVSLDHPLPGSAGAGPRWHLAGKGRDRELRCRALLSINRCAGEDLSCPASQRTEGSFIFYRPQLVMQVVGFTMEKDEYGAATSWTLELEEV